MYLYATELTVKHFVSRFKKANPLHDDMSSVSEMFEVHVAAEFMLCFVPALDLR